MLDTINSSRYGTETPINDTAREHRQSLEDLVLALLEGEFAGVLRTHIRGETYGGR